jgi:hypothetical protein
MRDDEVSTREDGLSNGGDGLATRVYEVEAAGERVSNADDGVERGEYGVSMGVYEGEREHIQ